MKQIIIAALVLCSALAKGQSDEVVILSPFEVVGPSDRIPPVTIRKTADFLLLQVEIVNDTRDPERRRVEIYDTVKGVIAAATQVKALEISTREMGLNLQNYQVRLEEKAGKADTSSVELVFRLPLAASDDVAALTAQLRQFSTRVQMVGRSEVLPGEIGISVKAPERFRYELIGHVADDVQKMKQLFGGSFEILVKGLDQRLQWRRVSVSELELYLPYSYDVLPNKGIPMLVHGES
ncbi:MAG: hypothetical protein IPL39_21450 [Opitutaceae bacterium]|nr:hypothetical protein [Opitutaceae bacterium]